MARLSSCAKGEDAVVGDDRDLVLAEAVAALLEQMIEPFALTPAHGVIDTLTNQNLLVLRRGCRLDYDRHARGARNTSGLPARANSFLADEMPAAYAAHLDTIRHL